MRPTNMMLEFAADTDNDTVTSCTVRNSSSGSAMKAEHDVTTLLWAVGGPSLLVVGVVGNVLILVTMTRRRMRGTSTCVYLCAMALLDLLVLVAGLTPNWLDGAGYLTIKKLCPAACKMEKFFDYTTGDSAVWCRVLFTLDRLVAVLMPLYLGRVCGRPSSARLYVVAACVAAVAKNLHVLVTRGAEFATQSVCINDTLQQRTVLDDVCGYPNERFREFEQFVRPWLAFVLVSAVPFAVIAICNSLIVGALVARRRQAIHAASSSSGHAGDKQFVQLAVMCVAASGLFLLCSLPSIILLIGKPYWNVPYGKNPGYQVSKAVSNLMFYVTFSANFFLYCLSGDRFRATLRGVLRRWFCCEAEDATAQLTTTTRNKSVSETHHQQRRNVTAQQRAALTSSLACAATPITATPVNVESSDSRLRPVGSNSRPMGSTDDSQRRTKDTTFIDQPAAKMQGDTGVVVQPKDVRALNDGVA